MNLLSVTESAIALVKLAFHVSLVFLSSGVGSVIGGPVGAFIGAAIGGTCLWTPIQDDWYILSKNSKSITSGLTGPVSNFIEKRKEKNKKTKAKQFVQNQSEQKQSLQSKKNTQSIPNKNKDSLKKKIMKKVAAYRMEKFKDERKWLERQKYGKRAVPKGKTPSLHFRQSNRSSR